MIGVKGQRRTLVIEGSPLAQTLASIIYVCPVTVPVGLSSRKRARGPEASSSVQLRQCEGRHTIGVVPYG